MENLRERENCKRIRGRFVHPSYSPPPESVLILRTSTCLIVISAIALDNIISLTLPITLAISDNKLKVTYGKFKYDFPAAILEVDNLQDVSNTVYEALESLAGALSRLLGRGLVAQAL